MDLAEDARRTIENSAGDPIEVVRLGDLIEIMYDVSGYEDIDRLASILSINVGVLNKFMKLRGSIRKDLALKLADRLRIYLKSEDQRFVSAKAPKPKKKPVAKPKPFTFEGESWVAVEISSEMKTKIKVVSTLLDSIVEQVKHSNQPLEEQAMTDIERKQLIAILETALAVLKGPLIEKGLLKKARTALESGATKAAEKGVQEGLGQVMGIAKGRIAELIAFVFS
jgi:hypothetical protein